ncbi:MAG: NAD(P)/FAD-dependent oxidoreductase [Actinobacteria bacterium]|nr:NAD(P)/FAD-dependent oxidoreductase [Actinomycetota bacterium]
MSDAGLDTAPRDLGHEEVTAVATEWLDALGRFLGTGDPAAAEDAFLADSWWRDLLALSLDLRTFHGIETISTQVAELLAGAEVSGLAPAPGRTPKLSFPTEETAWIELIFDFETPVARCRGVGRLVPDEGAPGGWKAWNVLTTMHELKGHEMVRGARRPIAEPRGGRREGENWAAARARQEEFAEAEPEVLVVGSGQGGLSVAASLELLGVPTLVIEKNERVGDNWRNRYRSLVLHDPVWADHLAYLPFPDSWPVYTPKDKLGDWLEHYAAAMELNVWTGCELADSAYDDGAGRWQVDVVRADGSKRTVRPAHVILATGALGEPRMPELPGADDFRGELMHSSGYRGGERWRGRRAVVVGACNSGHDIAQDLQREGAEVTLVQRSSTYVMSQANGIPVLFGGLYSEDGPDLEEADLLNASFPFPLVVEFAKAQTAAIAELDRDLLAALERVGFKTDMGDDGGGLMSRALRRGGGYYIDVGCSRLIAEGKIAVAQGVGIDGLTAAGVRFADGRVLEADLVVMATGFSNMRDTARRLFGDELGDRVKPVWDLDQEGEINTLWRDSGHPGFWFMGGPLVMARIYARYLALQIKAREIGLTGPGSAAATEEAG